MRLIAESGGELQSIPHSSGDLHFHRAMEKENKKAREDARREYNDTVRYLAKFLRKRDPRFQKHQRELDEIAKSKAAATASNSTSGPSTTAAAEFVEQEWQKPDPKAHGHADLEWGVAENENDEEWECVACGKSFRSEAAWDSHERSKKHLKAIEQLRMDMEMEDEELELQEEDGGAEEPPLSDEEDEEEDPPVIELDGEAEVSVNTEDRVQEEDASEEEDEQQKDSWDCVACQKSFKSKGAWESHERNKNHQKAMREYLKAQRSTGSSTKPSKTSTSRPQSPNPSPSNAIEDDIPPTAKSRSKKAKSRASPSQVELDDEDDGMPMSKTERKARRKAKLAEFGESQSQAQSQANSGISTPQPPEQEAEPEVPTQDSGVGPELPEPSNDHKKAKRKEKEKGKAGGTESVSPSKTSSTKGKEADHSQLQCNVCRESFVSKTKLFNHIRDEGHASAVPEKGGGSKKATKGKKR